MLAEQIIGSGVAFEDALAFKLFETQAYMEAVEGIERRIGRINIFGGYHRPNGDWQIMPVELWALIIGSTAIHRPYTLVPEPDEDAGWIVTHIATGLAAYAAEFKPDAVRVAFALSKVLPLDGKLGVPPSEKIKDAAKNAIAKGLAYSSNKLDWSKAVAIYCDGGVIGRNPSADGGTWAWCAVDAECNRLGGDSGVYSAPDGRTTNNRTEYLAACKALAAAPEGWSGMIYSDSKVTLGRLFWGYTNAGIPLSWVKRAHTELLPRLGKLTPELLQGHPTEDDIAAGVGKKRGYKVSIHNVWCDEECRKQAVKFLEDKNNGIRPLETRTSAASAAVCGAPLGSAQSLLAVPAGNRAPHPLPQDATVGLVDGPPEFNCGCPNHHDAAMCLSIRTGQELIGGGIDEECGCYCHEVHDNWLREEEEGY